MHAFEANTPFEKLPGTQINVPRLNLHKRPRHRRCPPSRDFVPWRFSDAGRRSAWIALVMPASENLHNLHNTGSSHTIRSARGRSPGRDVKLGPGRQGPDGICDATAGEGAARERRERSVLIRKKTRTSAQPILLDPDRDFIRNQRRVERIMLGIAEHELKGMFSGWQFDARLGLARAKMKMRLVLWNWFVGVEWFGHINQQMMMAAVLKIVARVGDTHVAQAEATPKSAFDRGAVLRPYEIQNGIFWRGLSLSPRGK